MLSIEIKVNGRLIESIDVVQIPQRELDMEQDRLVDELDPAGLRFYRVNGVYTIESRRGDGHRVLARKALAAVKQFKA